VGGSSPEGEQAQAGQGRQRAHHRSARLLPQVVAPATVPLTVTPHAKRAVGFDAVALICKVVRA
jgi:hypothetical protein